MAETFIELAQIPEKYSICEIDDQENEIPCTYSKIREIASQSVYAWIYGKSFNWRKDGDGWSGSWCDRAHDDEIKLSLYTAWDENNEPDKGFYFEAHHPDPARFPWVLEG